MRARKRVADRTTSGVGLRATCGVADGGRRVADRDGAARRHRPASGHLDEPHPEETDLVLTWLEQPGVRLVEVPGGWSMPARSAVAVGDPAAAVGDAA